MLLRQVILYDQNAVGQSELKFIKIGAVHGTPHRHHPNITADTVAALRLCTKLESMTWNDDRSAYYHMYN